ncbi:cyclopropane-fatty-acyl-phospholipid synthase family protein [Actinomadura sp. DC4]|uniref:SAM-dependent methyltransferase n=1 Tax=Actinomadura sp. DC4 TaxID=3055069 RepID=UPI0025AF0F58|nr:cyclopropane-fatty-acyl-phospholipid synthase family protein [Actinomadura sp. DC4]MDN3351624.1 cyclopropane-fatty-acyl-phospholipid synthase family protein [Actinomadura sp. DC4]
MTVAATMEPLLHRLFDGEPPVRIRAWDGSETGPSGGPVLVLRSRRALRRVLWRPGELGFARAYVTGDLDVDGDLAEGLRAVWASRPAGVPWARAAWLAVRLGVLGPPPRAPRSEARLSGREHTLRRDRAAIAHHYDVPAAFYELLLDESMAYSCAYFDDDDLAKAQRAKLGLVCRKLGLRPGMRLLDVGCGWGSLAVHAAAEYGVRVTGITLSEEQAAYARSRVKGLPVEIRVEDYRETGDGPYDAIASIEMGEHVGAANYPVFAARLHSLVRPGGPVLIQQMSRRSGSAPGGGPFIETYIAPDMHMRPVEETVGLLQGAGLEVRDLHGLREDYVRTAEAWSRNLESRWDEAVALIGEEGARVWRLYLAGGALAFEQDRMGVDQILATRPSEA